MSPILGVHHIAIIASDYQRSKHFYTAILGAEILHETYRAARQSYKLDLRLPDGVQIELFSFPHPPPRPSRPEACGLRHLAFKVENVAKAVEYFENQGISCEDIRLDEFTGMQYTFLADPDGLPIELYQAVDI